MAAGFLLAAAASCRGRLYGGHITGAAVLGCLCGLSGALLRECLLNGPDGVALVMRQLPGVVLAGALAGAVSGGLERFGERLFFWLDSLSLGLAACLGTLCGMRLGAAGALVLGLLAGLTPGLIRDVALGDTARAVEETWYATAAALGCMLTILLALLPSVQPLPWASGGEWGYACVLGGVLLVVLLRVWRGRRGVA